MPLMSTAGLLFHSFATDIEARHLAFGLDDARIVILSDLHRGAKDGADDFRRCELSTRQAFEYYWNEGFSLILLGDIEELWEVPRGRWHRIFDSYRDLYSVERRFADAGRYYRVFGNHDLGWATSRTVQHYLTPVLGEVEVFEAIVVELTDGPDEIGKLFVAHGHQADVKSDRLRHVSEPVVREIWARIQRILNNRSTRYKGSVELPFGRDASIYFDWAVTQTRTITVTGHTHNMVFEALGGTTLPERTEREIEKFRRRAQSADSIDLRKQLERLAALWQERYDRAFVSGLSTPSFRPAFFNCGCGSYHNGMVSALEIDSGELRMVTWSGPTREVQDDGKARASLRVIFDQLDGPVVGSELIETADIVKTVDEER